MQNFHEELGKAGACVGCGKNSPQAQKGKRDSADAGSRQAGRGHARIFHAQPTLLVNYSGPYARFVFEHVSI